MTTFGLDQFEQDRAELLRTRQPYQVNTWACTTCTRGWTAPAADGPATCTACGHPADLRDVHTVVPL
jgi:hypothetical protein